MKISGRDLAREIYEDIYKKLTLLREKKLSQN